MNSETFAKTSFDRRLYHQIILILPHENCIGMLKGYVPKEDNDLMPIIFDVGWDYGIWDIAERGMRYLEATGISTLPDSHLPEPIPIAELSEPVHHVRYRIMLQAWYAWTSGRQMEIILSDKETCQVVPISISGSTVLITMPNQEPVE